MSKKILLNILIIFLSIFSTIYANNVVYATKIDTIKIDGVDHKYTGPEVTLNLNGETFEVSEGLMPPIILEDRTLVPVREVFEILGGEVGWDSSERRVDVTLGSKNISLWIDNKNAKVDGETITTDVPAKIINDKTMVPVRFISEQGGLNVEWEAETKTVKINTPISNITDVEYMDINGVKCLVVNADSVISAYKYYMLDETEPYRLILDVKNSKFKIDTATRQIDDELVSTIRFGVQECNTNRIVLDLKSDTDYVVVQSKDKTKLYYAMSEDFTIPDEENIDESENANNSNSNENDSSGEVVLKPVDKPILGETTNPDENNNDVSGEKVNSGDELISGDSEKTEDIEKNETSDKITNEKDEESEKNDDKNIVDNEQNIVVPDVYITSIKYSTVSKRIRVEYDGEIEYSDMFLSNPNRLVIDIDNAELKVEGPKEITLKNNMITSVRFSQYEENKVRIVLDLKEKVDYKVYKRNDELQIAVIEPTYRNVVYKSNVANSQISLLDVDKDDISISHNEEKSRYTIKFSERDFDCGEGEIEPDDDFVKRITITETRINIYDTGEMSYNVRQSGNNVIITVKKDSKESSNDEEEKKIILIDPGHGGQDPGACNGNNYEKIYNFNIASMLYDLLSERDDIKVYMTRDSDTYLDREDRLEIANKINPDLIVSVHNNSLENKSYSGTMVLYYNNDTESQYGDITSKECAQIVLGKLIDSLETVNRGVVNRQDLHILSKTPCPSILCEICFISNDAELERLKTKTFQENAAEAIYDGVVEILKIM